MNKTKLNILTPIPFWHPGTQEFIDGLKENNFEVVALDIWSFNYYDDNQEIHSLVPKIFKGKLERVYKRLNRKRIIKKYIQKDQIVDIQWCGHYYSAYMKTIKSRGVRIVASLFGSDFYRSTNDQHVLQKIIYEYANIVVVGPNMHSDFVKVYPQFENKIKHCHFGSKRLNIIEKIYSSHKKNELKNKYGIPSDKITVAIGYNANESQQHFLFIDKLAALNKETKAKLFIILQMTYGNTGNYSNNVLQRVRDLKIDFFCLNNSENLKSNWLSDEELCELRIISDITVNVQTTDALSSSVKEAFAAQSILIVGNWLPYEIYEQLGLFFIRTSNENLLSNFIDVLNNYQKYAIFTKDNTSKIINFASWSRVLPNFIQNYKSL